MILRVAAHAIANNATVIQSDGDFEHVARVRSDFRHEWIAPGPDRPGHHINHHTW